MANVKVTALTENTSPVSTDIMYIVDDPAGSPLSQKVSLASLKTALAPTITTWATKNILENGASTEASQALSVNTTMYVGLFNLPAQITVNQISIDTAGAPGTNGTLKIAVYSEDGQTRHISITTATISADGMVSTAVAGVVLAPGSYYLGIMSVDTANITIRRVALSTIAGAQNSEVTGKKIYSGTLTVTADTPPTAFDPTSDITATTFGCWLARLDN